MSRTVFYVAAIPAMLLVALANQSAQVAAAPSPTAATATAPVDPAQAAIDALAAWPGEL